MEKKSFWGSGFKHTFGQLGNTIFDTVGRRSRLLRKLGKSALFQRAVEAEAKLLSFGL
jgi:hypothetical protein